MVALYGGFAYPLYGLCVAHTNDFVRREEFIEASSGLLLTWGIGASIGPLVAALAMELIGLGGLFLYTALVHSSFALVTLYRMTRREAVPAPERADFVHHATTTPEVAALDPRAPGSWVSRKTRIGRLSSAKRLAMRSVSWTIAWIWGSCSEGAMLPAPTVQKPWITSTTISPTLRSNAG